MRTFLALKPAYLDPATRQVEANPYGPVKRCEICGQPLLGTGLWWMRGCHAACLTKLGPPDLGNGGKA